MPAAMGLVIVIASVISIGDAVDEKRPLIVSLCCEILGMPGPRRLDEKMLTHRRE